MNNKTNLTIYNIQVCMFYFNLIAIYSSIDISMTSFLLQILLVAFRKIAQGNTSIRAPLPERIVIRYSPANKLTLRFSDYITGMANTNTTIKVKFGAFLFLSKYIIPK